MPESDAVGIGSQGVAEHGGGPEKISTLNTLREITSANVWDMTLPWIPEQQDLGVLARFKRCGFSFVSVTAQDFPATFDGVAHSIRLTVNLVNSQPEWLALGRTIDEIEQARRQGKLAIGFNVQDTCQVGTDLSRIRGLYELGVRHMLLAYQTRNLVADGCAEPSDAGLSIFGRRLVREMNTVGIEYRWNGRRLLAYRSTVLARSH
jgi:membrane dipeptidase